MIKYLGDREREYFDKICLTLGCNGVADEESEYCGACEVRHKREDEERQAYLEGR